MLTLYIRTEVLQLQCG